MKKVIKCIILLSSFLIIIIISGCRDSEGAYLPEGAGEGTGYIETPGYSKEVFADGDFAYVVDDKWGIQIIDISDRKVPLLTGNIKTSWAWDFYLYGQYGLIADYASGLVIADLSNKQEPEIILKEDMLIGASSIFVEDNYAYVTDHSGKLLIIDITDAANPVRLSVLEGIGWVYDIYVTDGYGYVIYKSEKSDEKRLNIYRLNNLKDPGLISSIPIGGTPIEIAVIGDYAYIAGGRYGIISVNISDTENPYESSVFNIEDEATDIFITKGYAYIADRQKGVIKAALDSTGRISVIKRWEVPGYSDGVFAADGYIYVANYDGLVIIEDK